MTMQRAEKMAFYLATAFVVYMPLHIFLSQWLSTFTGGLEIWKAAKDVLLVLAVFPLLFLAYKQGSFTSRFFRWFIWLGATYVSLYMLFLLFDKNADTRSAITGSVYNTRVLGYFLLGWVVARSENGAVYAKKLLKLALVMFGVVATFGVLQYFLPKDFLAHFGYSLERGVKPMFFIDDKPDFPRVMSTLRDPNSLGAFLVFPILYGVFFLFVKHSKDTWLVLSKNRLRYICVVSFVCLLLAFSRSGGVALFASLSALLAVAMRKHIKKFKKIIPFVLVSVLLLGVGSTLVFKDTYLFKNVVLHSDEKTAEQDPNELRVSLNKQISQHISEHPLGEGPGSAGLVSINNPKGTQLTENYYLQIAYEVGVLGLLLFVALYAVVSYKLLRTKQSLASILFASSCGLALFSFLNHSWSNEALALQWWLFAGVVTASSVHKQASLAE